VIDYETFARIRDCRDRQGLTITQIARTLGLHRQTVAKWLARSRFERPRPPPRNSLLDPFKGRITRLLDTHPYSAQQIFQRLREEGYGGGVTILRDYVGRIRPPKLPVYLKLHFAPGECAQVDWGVFGTVAVGNTRRRLSFFVIVLAYSRLMYVEFTVSQTMEHFLSCHEHAFAAFGGVPTKIMVDNLKSAVLQRLAGVAPVFNPRYVDFARHYGFAIAPCNVARGNEKGRVESGVGYVKKNFLRGLELTEFGAIQAAAQVWLDTIANVRIHGERSRAREQRLMLRFLALSPDAQAYYDGLEQKRLNARHHLRKILALADVYPADSIARALSDGLTFQAFSAEYIANILETRARTLPEPGPLQLTRAHDLLDIDIPPPDLNVYETNHDPE